MLDGKAAAAAIRDETTLRAAIPAAGQVRARST
jgi:hypothetical protein